MFETNIGEWGLYNGQKVPLDCPLVKLNQEGTKAHYVYVKDNNGKTIKIITPKNK